MRSSMFTRLIVALVTGIVSGGLLARPALGQTMSFSVYHNVSLSSGGQTAYATATVSDNSTGCSHGNYYTTINIYSPSNRRATSGSTGLTATTSIPVNGEYGMYRIVDVGTYQCSCFKYSTVSFGGGGTFEIFLKIFTYKFRRIDGNYGWWIYDRCNPGTMCSTVNLLGAFHPSVTTPPPYAVSEQGVLRDSHATICQRGANHAPATNCVADPRP
jgi:hypothetical protein